MICNGNNDDADVKGMFFSFQLPNGSAGDKGTSLYNLPCRESAEVLVDKMDVGSLDLALTRRPFAFD